MYLRPAPSKTRVWCLTQSYPHEAGQTLRAGTVALRPQCPSLSKLLRLQCVSKEQGPVAFSRMVGTKVTLPTLVCAKACLRSPGKRKAYVLDPVGNRNSNPCQVPCKTTSMACFSLWRATSTIWREQRQGARTGERRARGFHLSEMTVGRSLQPRILPVAHIILSDQKDSFCC